jgi:alpha-galactosidase
MIGSDIRNMDESTKTILLNKEIIAIDQDVLGKQGIRVMRKDGLEAWKKQLSGDRVAIAFLNRNSWNETITATWEDLELDPDLRFSIYDVWKHQQVKHEAGILSARLKPHECQVFLLSLAVIE